MPLETATYIANLNAANPASTDPKSQGDDHLRMIKSVLQNSFAGFPGMVVVTGSEAQGATTNDYVVTISPAPTAYTASMLVLFKATHANTGAATLKINSLAAKPLVTVDGSPLAAGAVENGGIAAAYYDGTQFYLISCIPKAASMAYVDAGLALKADINSPAFTGTPTAPTPLTNDNSTRIATTAFVVQQAFQAALPAQPNDGAQYVLISQNGVASWVFAGAPGFLLMSQGVI
jgi:hypothetical protein